MSPETQPCQTTETPLNEASENSKETILAPSLADTSPSVSDIFKVLVTSGLAEIPFVGNILSGLVGLLWPEGPSVWDQVKAEVEKMVDEKVNQAVFSLLKAKLDGLGESLQVYLGLIAKKASSETIRMQFIATNTLLVAAAPEFKNADYQWTLGPLFAMFSILHISLLRDCVLHGDAWKWPSHDDFQCYTDLAKSRLKDYIGHIDKVLSDKMMILERKAPTKPGQHRTNIYNYWQAFNLHKVVAFDDYRQLLIYLDPIAHPGKTERVPFADAYSRAYGIADNWDTTASGGVSTPYGGPLTMIDTIYQEWFDYGPRVINVRHKSNGPQFNGGNRVNEYGIITKYSPKLLNPLGREAPSVGVSSSLGEGLPGGVNCNDNSFGLDNGEAGDDFGGGVETKTTTFTPVAGRDFVIQKASLRSGNIPLTLKLILYNGQEEKMWDKRISGGTWYNIEIEGRMLTTLNMWANWSHNDDLGCIIFGFSRDSQYVPPKVLDLLYVTSIYEPGDNPSDTPKEELDKKRTVYWDKLKCCAEEEYPSSE